jgi:site-specific DNA recombinase
MKVAIYCRVSTKGQTLEQQIEACKRFCAFKELEIGEIYAEKLSSAKKIRPEYLRCVEDLRNYKYDGVVVFRIDRFGRNSRELVMIIEELEGKGIKVLSVHDNFDTSTAMGRFMFQLICNMAQLEREQIGEATSQRLQALKASGKRLGQKPCSGYQVNKVKELAGTGLSLRKIAKEMQISHVTVGNIVNQKGYYSIPCESAKV